MVLPYVPAMPAKAKAVDYGIQKVMLQLTGNADNPDSFTIDLPTDGRILFHCSQKILWKLDGDEEGHLAGRFEAYRYGGSWTTGRGDDPGFRDGKFYDPVGKYYAYSKDIERGDSISSSYALNYSSSAFGDGYYNRDAIIGDYWGSITKGSHTFAVSDYNGGSEDCVLAYVFYPTCPVYYLDGEDWQQLTSYVRYEEDMYDDSTPTWYVPSEITLIDPPARQGYTFEGWYEDQNLTQPIEKIDTSIRKEWYLYPKFTPNSYTITYDLMGGSGNGGNPDSYTIESGTLHLRPAVRKGYSFERWYERIGTEKVTVTDIDPATCEDIELYAEWSKDTYTITYQDGFTHSNPATYQVTDPAITLTAAERPGCEFDSWYEDEAHTVKLTAIDCAELAKNVTIYAGWNPISYPVTYELGGGTNNAANPASYTVVEEPVTLQAPERKGYTFTGWYRMDGSDRVDVTQIDTSACAPLTLCADWSKNTNLTFVNGYDHTNQDSFPVTYGTYRLKDASRAGYRFTGWYRDEECTDKVTEIDCSGAEDITLYAGWELQTYTVEYVLNGGTNDAANLTSYSAEASFELRDPVKKGYDFMGWFEDSSYTKKVEDAGITVFRNMTLYAKWQEHDYQITYVNAFSHSNPSTYRMAGSPLVLGDAQRDGYRFAGWYADEECEQQVTALDRTKAEDVTLYAKWELVEYTVTWHLNGGTNAQANVESYSAEAPAALSAPSRTGYDFDGWYLDETFRQSVTRIGETVFGDLHIYAKWTPHAYRISYEDCGTHSNPATYTVEDGRLELAEAKKTGYRFLGWYQGSTSQTKVEMLDCSEAKDVTLVAKWENIEYPVRYELGGGTNAADNIEYFTVETSFELKDPSRTGYDFKGWYTDAEKTQQVRKVDSSLMGDLTLYAKWELHTYTITYVDGENETTATYTVEDQNAALSVPEKKGMDFQGWYTDGGYETKVEAVDLKAPGDLTLYAKWALHSYTITYVHGGENDPGNISEYTIDNVFTLKAARKTGYDFDGWYLDEELETKVEEISSDLPGDVTLYAGWKPHSYTITYVDGGRHSNVEAYTVEDASITLEPAVKEGFQFEGWYADAGFEQQVKTVETEKACDVKLYAKWSSSVYNIRYELDGGENNSENIPQYVISTKFEFQAPEKEHYDFKGWFTDIEKQQEIKEIDGNTGDLTLYAAWEPHQYKITVVDGYTHSIPAVYTVEQETVPLEDADREGYLFEGWYLDKELTKKVESLNPQKDGEAEDITIYGCWTSAKYKVVKKTAELAEGESLQISCASDGYLEFKSESNGGFTFDSMEGQLADAFSGKVEKGTHILTAKSVDGGGKAVVSYVFRPACTVYVQKDGEWNSLFSYGLADVSTAHALPEKYEEFEGYTVTEWYLDADMKNKVTQIDESKGQDWYVYPKLVPNVYRIQYETGSGTHENPVQYTVEDGIIKLKAAEQEGYTFKRWYRLEGAEKVTVTEIDCSLCQDYKLYAEWETASYTITYVDGYTHANPVSYTLEDPDITLMNASRNGYLFMGWFIDEVLSEPVTVIRTADGGDVKLYASWKEESYEVQYVLNGGINAEENRDSFTPDTIFEVEAPTRQHYDFVGWFVDASCQSAFVALDDPVCRDVKLYAKWEPHAYEITYELNGGINAAQNPEEFTVEDSPIVLEEPERSGYSFAGWYFMNGDAKMFVTQTDPGWQDDVTLYAEWEAEAAEDPAHGTSQTPAASTTEAPSAAKPSSQTPSTTKPSSQTPVVTIPSSQNAGADDEEAEDEEDDEEEIPTVSKVGTFKATAKKKALRITWKAQKGVAGYQIQACLKKNFKGVKTITAKKNATAYTVKKLKAKKKYYVRIRAYKTYKASNGKTKTVYGKWTVITKKTK